MDALNRPLLGSRQYRCLLARPVYPFFYFFPCHPCCLSRCSSPLPLHVCKLLFDDGLAGRLGDLSCCPRREARQRIVAACVKRVRALDMSVSLTCPSLSCLFFFSFFLSLAVCAHFVFVPVPLFHDSSIAPTFFFTSRIAPLYNSVRSLQELAIYVRKGSQQLSNFSSGVFLQLV